MFQYTHELVLNNFDSNSFVWDGTNKVLTIKRGGEYKTRFVQGGVVYKTAPVAGAFDKWTLDVSKLNLESGKNYALSIFVKLVDPHAFFEYGYPNYNSFGKQILVDFKSVDATTDAQTILDSILPQNMENDLTFVKGSVSSSSVILEVGHYGLRIDSMSLAEYDPTTCDSCIGEYMTPKGIIDHGAAVSIWGTGAQAAATHTTTGVDPFATGEWLIENLRFPSYPNIRWAAVGESNRPIPGESYTMFSFAYESPRPGLGGLSGVGQKLEAVTRHIYYVRGNASTSGTPAYAFASAIANIGSVIDSSSANPIGNEVSVNEAVASAAADVAAIKTAASSASDFSEFKAALAD